VGRSGFKGVSLEGLEVVFIVITFGLSATRYDSHGLLVASASAALAGFLVIVAGVIARRPLSAVPENTMKYAVGLLLTSFGTFWAVEGLGYFGSGVSLAWPGQDWAILGLVVVGFGPSQLAVAGLRPRRRPAHASWAPPSIPEPGPAGQRVGRSFLSHSCEECSVDDNSSAPAPITRV
jgi:Ca2+/H+ antiporter, TMEM165/GDT1 family